MSVEWQFMRVGQLGGDAASLGFLFGRGCRLPRASSYCRSAPHTSHSREAGYGRVCEVTSGCFVEAKQEKRWLAVRPLWSDPAGRFGSAAPFRSLQQQSFIRAPVLAGPHEPQTTAIFWGGVLGLIRERQLSEWSARSA
jgi:hypothetical protein